MIQKYFIALAVAFIISFSIATTQAAFAPLVVIQEQPKAKRNDIQLAVSKYAFIYNVSEDVLFKVIKCESNFNQYAINDTPKEYSVGLSQLNLKAHKNITIEQAQDIDFAIDFLAKNISQNRGSMWTCWNNLI